MRTPAVFAARAAVLLASAFTALGCGESDGLSRASVSGKVTLDGKPLSNGSIQFIPKNGDSRAAAWGQILDGLYAMSGADGPAAGEYVVSITPDSHSSAAASSEPTPDVPAGEPPPEAQTGPEAVYTSETPLKAVVEPGRANTFDFALTSARASRERRR